MVKTSMCVDSSIRGDQLEADSGSFTDCSGQARVTSWPRTIMCKIDVPKQ